MSNLFISLFVVFGLLQVLDVVSTARALKNPDLAEGNPVARFFIKKLGVVGGLVAIKAILAAFLVWVLNRYPFGTTVDLVSLVIANLIYLAIVVNNFRLNK
jgi:hypothetical protein